MIIIVLIEENHLLHLTQEGRKLEIRNYNILGIPEPREYKTQTKNMAYWRPSYFVSFPEYSQDC
jgi:hypothetical protein